MAKAKKSGSERSNPPAGDATGEKSTSKAKKAGAAKSEAPAQEMLPPIDTNLAASTAAKRVARKDEPAASMGGQRESAAFKQLKENLHKPAQSTPSFLQNVAPSKKFNNSVPGRNQQIGRNQTFGADVNRTGVPRRTGGG